MGELVRLEDGAGLNVVRRGPADAALTVVLAHGYALDHRTWHRVVAGLPEDVQVIAYDHRGHGASSPAGSCWPVTRWAAWP